MEILDVNNENVLGIKIKHRVTSYKLVLLLVYLPPENSTYCKDAGAIFDELLLHAYTTANWDNFIIMGDFNARMGDLKDYCVNDNIPKRSVLDNKVNSHGKDLITLLLESRYCVLNGRLGTNDYTLENKVGKSVVDYIVVRQDDFDQFRDFGVTDCLSLVTDGSKVHNRSCLPDHNSITVSVNISSISSLINEDKNLGGCKEPTKQKVVRVLPDGYMESSRAREAIIKMIKRIEGINKNQMEVDKIYEEFVNLIKSEADVSSQVKRK